MTVRETSVFSYPRGDVMTSLRTLVDQLNRKQREAGDVTAESLAALQTDLESQIDTAEALIGALESNVTALDSQVTTNAGQITDIFAQLDILEGSGVTAQQAFVIGLVTAVDTVLGSVSNQVLQLKKQSEALAQAAITEIIRGREDGAAIRVEQAVRTTETLSLAQQITSLTADLSNANASIVAEQTARVGADNSLLTTFNAGITAEAANRAAAVAAEAAARAAAIADEAQARADAIGDESAIREAAIATEQSNRAAAVAAEAAARANAINAEATARQAGDQALAADITTLTTTVNGNTAQISTIAASLDGVEARWGVVINLNGQVTGLVQLDGSASGSNFTVVADRFIVAQPSVSGGDPIPVFAIDTVNGAAKLALRGDMFADGTIIARTVAANAITADKIAANAVTAGKISVGSLSAITATLGSVTTGRIQSPDGKLDIRADGGGTYIRLTS